LDKNKTENQLQSSKENEFSNGSVVFDKFEIVSVVSAGGFGRVYKARDIHRNLDVALKVLLVETNDEKALVRFQREARTASRLKHRNIATINDFGLSNGIPYLSMEFVDGISLEEIICKDATLKLPDFIAIFTQVSAGLIHAHNNGVVHRDLKPANIVVRETPDGKLIAKVLDFGVATLIDRAQDEQGRLTPTGNIVGSPLYMSPEQGHGESVTQQSDVYSLGCMMYRCLTGQPPFCGETALETIVAHIEADPPPLAQNLADPMPEELCQLIDRMLAKKPGQRPHLEGEVFHLLEHLSNELSNLEEKDNEKKSNVSSIVQYTTVIPERPIGSRVKVFTIFSLLLMIPVLLAVIQANRRDDTDKKTKPPEFQTPAVFLDPTQVEGVISSKNKSPDRLLKAYKGQARYSLDKTGLTDADLLKLEPALQLKSLDLSKTYVKTLEHIGNFRNLERLSCDETPISDGALKKLGSLKKLQSLIINHTSISDASLPDIARLTGLIGLYVRRTRISANGIVNGLKPLVNLQTLQIGHNNKITIEQCRQIVHTFPKLTEFQINDCDKVKDEDLEILSKDYPDIAFPPRKRGINELLAKSKVAKKAKDLKQAQLSLESVNKMLRRAYGQSSERLLPHLFESAANALHSGDLQTAEKEFGEFAEIAELNHEYSIELLESLSHLSNIALAKNEIKKQEAIQQRAYKIAKLIGFWDLEERAFNIGNYYFGRGETSTALKYYQDALAIRKRNQSWKNPQTALLLTVCAECKMNLGQSTQARNDHKTAIQLYSKFTPETDHQKGGYSASYRGLSDLDYRDGKIDSAMQNNEKSFLLCKKFRVAPIYLIAVLRQRHSIYLALNKSAAELQAVKDQLDSALNAQKANQAKTSTRP
jgi:serine/threonine protein kinase/tetratricopeptide (TPR) repeat protein